MAGARAHRFESFGPGKAHFVIPEITDGRIGRNEGRSGKAPAQAANRIMRKEDRVPAIVYGDNEEPQNITVGRKAMSSSR